VRGGYGFFDGAFLFCFIGVGGALVGEGFWMCCVVGWLVVERSCVIFVLCLLVLCGVGEGFVDVLCFCFSLWFVFLYLPRPWVFFFGWALVCLVGCAWCFLLLVVGGTPRFQPPVPWH